MEDNPTHSLTNFQGIIKLGLQRKIGKIPHLQLNGVN